MRPHSATSQKKTSSYCCRENLKCHKFSKCLLFSCKQLRGASFVLRRQQHSVDNKFPSSYGNQNFITAFTKPASPRPCVKFHIMPEDHPLLAAHECLFNIFTATLHIWWSAPSCATWWCAVTQDQLNCQLLSTTLRQKTQDGPKFDCGSSVQGHV
jgi:hypothetical protein